MFAEEGGFMLLLVKGKLSGGCVREQEKSERKGMYLIKSVKRCVFIQISLERKREKFCVFTRSCSIAAMAAPVRSSQSARIILSPHST